MIGTGAHRARLPYFRQLQLAAVAFVLPAFLILGVFRIAPIFMSARLSLFDYNLLSGRSRFVAVDNYQTALADRGLHNSLKVTALFVAIKMPLQVVLSLGLAMLVNRRTFGIGLVRSAPLMAVVMPLSISAVLWRLMYHPSNGIINSILQSVGIAAQPFLVSASQALPALIGMTLWQDLGFYMIIYLAGLQGIPQEYYDAARVDGASPWQEFWHVTVPLLARTTVLVLILSTVFSFQVFIPVYIMTAGGPAGSTDVVVYFMYKAAFQFMRMGYANAISMIILAIVLAVSVLQLRASRAQH